MIKKRENFTSNHDRTSRNIRRTLPLLAIVMACVVSAAFALSNNHHQIPATTTPATQTNQDEALSRPNFESAISTGKRFTSTAATSNLLAATSIAEAQNALQSFATQYNIAIEITHVDASSYVEQYDTYGLLGDSDLATLKTYGSLFIDEWSKYPTDWVTSSQLKSIAFVKKFATSGTFRAAGPDPIGEAMYYDVSHSGDYAREVIHHEFDHLITYNDSGNYEPSDPTWESYNTPGFTYGNGGASCYQAENTCLSGSHPITGFVTGYAASAIEEDKAELYAYLMTNTYYHQLQDWLHQDTSLKNKVNNYKDYIVGKSPAMSGNYYNEINP